MLGIQSVKGVQEYAEAKIEDWHQVLGQYTDSIEQVDGLRKHFEEKMSLVHAKQSRAAKGFFEMSKTQQQRIKEHCGDVMNEMHALHDHEGRLFDMSNEATALFERIQAIGQNAIVDDVAVVDGIKDIVVELFENMPARFDEGYDRYVQKLKLLYQADIFDKLLHCKRLAQYGTANEQKRYYVDQFSLTNQRAKYFKDQLDYMNAQRAKFDSAWQRMAHNLKARAESYRSLVDSVCNKLDGLLYQAAQATEEMYDLPDR